MTNLSILFTLAISLGLVFNSQVNASDSHTKVSIDNSESTLYWKGYKVGGWHEGYVTIKEGSLEFTDDGTFTGGNFVIDMSTIISTDLSGSSKERLENHLKSDDFFGVETHPEAYLDIKRVISRGKPGDYRIVADLTIKDITHEIRFNTVMEDKGEKKTAEAEFVVDRSLFDVRFGSGTFFSNLGDNTIYDEFDIKVNLITK